MPTTPPSPHDFTLHYRPDEHILIGRWLRQTGLPEIQAAYEALLTQAQAHDNCRHWLLDIRRRTAGDQQGTAWFGEHFIPRLLPALGGPVSIAYFAMIDHVAATTIHGVLQNVQQGQQAQHQFRYFNQEGEALAWLTGQPTS